MWFEESVIYHIYPLGLCGAPQENDGQRQPRLRALIGWCDHIRSLGCNAVYLGPVMESDTHGYDTRDYRVVDARLGTNEDLAAVCDAFHAAGLRVILEGVFHHVGRGFFAFQDVCRRRQDSPYADWFYLNFDGDSPYHDGFWYEGWEGHYELVKLNLHSPALVDYLLTSVGEWLEAYHIDGLRLDVAYLLDEMFLQTLTSYVRARRADFFFLGEMIHGDYNRLLTVLDSVTNYECYKGLYSSFNDRNLFEIGHSLLRQFGKDPWSLYRGRPLTCFADNHDVSRVASLLQEIRHLLPLYGLMFAMPGIPMVYYGSEWGAQGRKEDGDAALRPCFPAPVENDLSREIARLAACRRASPALCHGDLEVAHLTNRQLAIRRSAAGQTVLACVNADDAPYTFPSGLFGRGTELREGTPVDGGAFTLPAFGLSYIECET